MKRTLFITTALILLTTFFSCSTTGVLKQKENFTITEINLQDPNLKLVTYPQKEGWVRPKKVEDFARIEKCFAAINANPFNKKIKYLENSKVKPIGIYVDHGQLYSQPSEKYAGLAFYRDGEGYVALLSQNQALLLENNPVVAVGGYWIILEGDTEFQFKDIKNFRSAAGISKDGRTLYLFTGKNLSFQECAAILKEKGAWAAIQFDGGHASQMVLNGKKTQEFAVHQLPAVILGFSH